ncbi:Predicted DNA-binding transcriptional regulator YafY, contains an HTH and WYL domains [Catalinimonas alkaloidigena]|uniref:Predicted DNA-binding transcriptional regulator YafY, contains an HTH and WYL domains n=1 Tax=Catalinimonas alkaloidigena TaxID=1075417 RepID=A0A1G9RPQ1_9BACT|nr:YafY family protein [Catalinimonas alkaloidigena]SDM25164.1 Predicted DNA-binding transcriptional regulator YafY, contains an HTH and WYL domains [Catalinimonas alkaloidigena]
MHRLDRLTALLTLLQSKPVITAQELADRFAVSLRTIYRDVRALEAAGVPVGAEAGKGYYLPEGYRLPPVMFTPDEAGALLLGAKLVEQWSDQSVGPAFQSALSKIRAVLRPGDKARLAELDDRVAVFRPASSGGARAKKSEFPDHFLTTLQQALSQHRVVELDYFSSYNQTWTRRTVEPIGLLYYGSGWHLIAHCRLRQAQRDFRVDRMKNLAVLAAQYTPVAPFNPQEYMTPPSCVTEKTEEVAVLFKGNTARFTAEQRYLWGFTHEVKIPEGTRLHFETPFLPGMARWLLPFGNRIRVESPDRLLHLLQDLAREVQHHYLPEEVVAPVEE